VEVINRLKLESRGVAATLIGLTLCCGAAFAQSMPSSCVMDLNKQYGSTSALRTECKTASDCTFQAPMGDASALALIGAMVKRVEACFAAAGFSVVKEDVAPRGITRQYGKPGAAEMCAVLISTRMGDLADGLRATCQPVTAR
jgi:hypothetical protein